MSKDAGGTFSHPWSTFRLLFSAKGTVAAVSQKCSQPWPSSPFPSSSSSSFSFSSPQILLYSQKATPAQPRRTVGPLAGGKNMFSKKEDAAAMIAGVGRHPRS